MIAAPRNLHNVRFLHFITVLDEARKSLDFSQGTNGNLRRRDNRRHVRPSNGTNVAQRKGCIRNVALGQGALRGLFRKLKKW